MINEEWRDEILILRDQYCAATGIAPATLAHKSAGDGDFFDRLENGGGCGVDKYIEVKAWFEENMPVNTSSKRRK
jgi:hypothetical protein